LLEGSFTSKDYPAIAESWRSMMWAPVSFETFLGYFTGLRLLGGNLPLSSLVVTAVIVHLLDGIMCRLFARNNGYPKNLWTVLGFFFGIWAVATLILLPKRQED
jgi:hypothetical protein